ncbi:MAG: ribonuclease Z, partial [Anoxybacillus sp.]
PPKKGRKLAILGDTRYCDASVELAEEVDVLVHEATFSANEARLAHDYYHSTTVQAAEVAKRARAKQLILTHISSRYQGEMCNQLVEEAKAIFPNVAMASDFASFPIPKRSVE